MPLPTSTITGGTRQVGRVLRRSIAALRCRGLHPTTYDDWRRIEAAEADRGSGRGRDRTKIEAWSELLDLVALDRPGGPPTPADREA